MHLVINHHACAEYLAKSEKLSDIALDAFLNAVTHLANEASPKVAVCKLEIKAAEKKRYGNTGGNSSTSVVVIT